MATTNKPITFGTVVPVPADQAFAFVSEPTNWPLFFSNVRSVDKGKDWGSVGGHARITSSFLGRPLESELEITEWDPPTGFRYTMRSSDQSDLDHRRVFEPVDGGTRLRGTTELATAIRSGLAGLIDRIKMRALQRMYDKAMARLPEVAAQHTTMA